MCLLFHSNLVVLVTFCRKFVVQVIVIPSIIFHEVYVLCNGAPIACTVTVQATYYEHRVSWCLEISRTRIMQRNVLVLIQGKGKSRTIFSMVNLLLVNPILSSFNYIYIQTCIVTICSPLIAFFWCGSALLLIATIALSTNKLCITSASRYYLLNNIVRI